MPTSRVLLSRGRSQVLQTQPCFSTKFLCAEGSASRVVRSLETSRQLEAHFPELCRSWREAGGPSSSARMSASWSLCFWRILVPLITRKVIASFYPADCVPGPVSRASPDYLVSPFTFPTLLGGRGHYHQFPLPGEETELRVWRKRQGSTRGHRTPKLMPRSPLQRVRSGALIPGRSFSAPLRSVLPETWWHKDRPGACFAHLLMRGGWRD